MSEDANSSAPADAASPKSSGADIGKARIGTIYAKALLGVAENGGRAQELVGELSDLVTGVIDRFPAFGNTLASARLSADEKTAILDRTLGGRVSDELLRFLKVVCQHGRMDCLREIRQAAQEQFQVRHGRVTVKLTTAEPLSADLQQRIQDGLSHKLGKSVELQTHVDAELLGGMVVRVGDTVFDGSIANRFARLRTEAVERTYEQLRQSADQLAGELSL